MANDENELPGAWHRENKRAQISMRSAAAHANNGSEKAKNQASEIIRREENQQKI